MAFFEIALDEKWLHIRLAKERERMEPDVRLIRGLMDQVKKGAQDADGLIFEGSSPYFFPPIDWRTRLSKSEFMEVMESLYELLLLFKNLSIPIGAILAGHVSGFGLDLLRVFPNRFYFEGHPLTMAGFDPGASFLLHHTLLSLPIACEGRTKGLDCGEGVQASWVTQSFSSEAKPRGFESLRELMQTFGKEASKPSSPLEKNPLFRSGLTREDRVLLDQLFKDMALVAGTSRNLWTILERRFPPPLGSNPALLVGLIGTDSVLSVWIPRMLKAGIVLHWYCHKPRRLERSYLKITQEWSACPIGLRKNLNYGITPSGLAPCSLILVFEPDKKELQTAYQLEETHPVFWPSTMGKKAQALQFELFVLPGQVGAMEVFGASLLKEEAKKKLGALCQWTHLLLFTPRERVPAVSRRLIQTFLGEALCLLREGISFKDIDEITIEIGFRNGPFELFSLQDFASWQELLSEPITYYAQSPSLKSDQLESSLLSLGRQGGKKAPLNREWVAERIMISLQIEAVRCLTDFAPSMDAEDIDLLAYIVVGFPWRWGGPLFGIDQKGPQTVFDTCQFLARSIEGRFKAPQTLEDHAQTGKLFFE